MIKNLVEQEQLKEQLKEVNDDIEALNTDVNAVEDETLYARNGGSFMGVNESGEVYKIVVPPNQSKEIPIEVKTVVQSHDEALEKVALAAMPAYKGSATVSKGGGTYSFPTPLEGDLKSVGYGIYFVTVYAANTVWRYAGILTVGQLGSIYLTELITSENIGVSVVSDKLQITNKNASYDVKSYVTLTKIGGV